MKSKVLVFFLLLLISFYPNNTQTEGNNVRILFASDTTKIQLQKPKENDIKPLYTNIRGSIYHCVSNQTDDTPFITASGYKIDTAKLNRNEIRVVALSQDLIRCYGLGGKIRYPQKIYVESRYSKLRGWWTVRDCMPSYRKNSMDFLQPVSGGFTGVWKDIKIYTEEPIKRK